MLGLTGITGTALLTAGTFSLFSANVDSGSETFAAGTVQIKVFDGNDCVGTDWSTSPQNLSVNYFLPGTARSKEFVVQNTGSLDEWVGVLATLPRGLPLQVQYTVDVYQPDPNATQTSEPDRNGDIHSNCHTGSKGRGAGGEDKGGGDNSETDMLLHTYTSTWFSTSDTTPQVPFELPVGDHAHVTYCYKLVNGLSAKYQHTSSPLKFDVWAVQYQNNINTSSDKLVPFSWAPQPGN
jgi:hypothetical protein